jgi:hypothetical protein
LRDEPRKFRSYQILDLISKSNLPPTYRLLLHLVVRHTNHKTGIAWASQQRLAEEMGAGESSVKRWFGELRAAGAIGVRRVRSGKDQKKQYNEYWIVPEKLPGLKLDQGSLVSPAQGADQGSFRTRPGLATDETRAHSYEPVGLDRGGDRATSAVGSVRDEVEVNVVSRSPREARNSENRTANPPAAVHSLTLRVITPKPETKTSNPEREAEQRRRIESRDARLQHEAYGQYRENHNHRKELIQMPDSIELYGQTFHCTCGPNGKGKGNCYVHRTPRVHCDHCKPLPNSIHHRSWCPLMPDSDKNFWKEHQKYHRKKQAIERKAASRNRMCD